MFRSLLAADIGSMNMKFAAKSGIRCEACCLTVENEGGVARLTSIGDEAASKRGSGVIHPMRGGAVANAGMLALLLQRAACDMTGKRSAGYVELHIAAPRVIGTLKQSALKQAVRLAGFKDLALHDALLMGAVGAGLDVFGERASMLVNIGSETIACAAVANGGVLFESMDACGSSLIDNAIQQYFRSEHGLLIGWRTAETIKKNLDRQGFRVDGRSWRSGFPETVTADGVSLRRTAETGALVMARTVEDAIKALQPDAVADLAYNGITLVGGGAKQFGLASLFEAELGVPVAVAPNADTAVIEGMKECLIDRPGHYRRVGAVYSRAADEAYPNAGAPAAAGSDAAS